MKKRGELIFGGDAEGGGPFVFPREDDPTQVQGFEIDLANLLAAKLGVKARFSQGQWEKLPDLLERGDIDVVLNGYEWTPTWSQRYAASIPYYVYELQMLVRKNDDAPEGARRTSAMPGSDGKRRIAVLGGSAAETYVRKTFGDNVEVVIYEGTTDAMRAVELAIDGVDATLQDLPIVTFYETRFPAAAAARRAGRAGVLRRARAAGGPAADPGPQRGDPGLLSGRQLSAGAAEVRNVERNAAAARLVTDARGNFQPDPPAATRAASARRRSARDHLAHTH